jgi:REP element-mobilizing transposase RayT
MPRRLRDQSEGIRHVICRGNRRQPIFLDDQDRAWYLGILEHASRLLSWRVLGWCLMTNHVHLVLDVPAATISKGMQLVSGEYGQGFNWRHGYSGHLFQGRFHAVSVLDDEHLLELVPYVDLNPERAGIVDSAELWRWSSHRAHLGLEPPRPFHDVSWVRSFGSTAEGAAAAYAAHVQAARGHVHSRHAGV